MLEKSYHSVIKPKLTLLALFKICLGSNVLIVNKKHLFSPKMRIIIVILCVSSIKLDCFAKFL